MKHSRNLGDLAQWTKIELSQVINQALLNKKEPLPADHFRVQRMANRSKKAELIRNCELAIEIISKEQREKR